MELMLTVALAALIISIAVPTFIGINRGAAAKQADNMVYASLKQAQQYAILNRQRVSFCIVTSVLLTNNVWVTANMVNRGFFLYASDAPNIQNREALLTQIQMLPSPMMFDLTGSLLPADKTMKDGNTGNSIFTYRCFRFAPSGGVYWPDADATGVRQYDIVITEGLAGPGGTLTPRTTGTVIRYTNSVNVYTGKVFRPWSS